MRFYRASRLLRLMIRYELPCYDWYLTCMLLSILPASTNRRPAWIKTLSVIWRRCCITRLKLHISHSYFIMIIMTAFEKILQVFAQTGIRTLNILIHIFWLKPLGIFAFLQPHLFDLVRWKRLSDQVNLLYAIWTPGAFSCWLFSVSSILAMTIKPG